MRDLFKTIFKNKNNNLKLNNMEKYYYELKTKEELKPFMNKAFTASKRMNDPKHVFFKNTIESCKKTFDTTEEDNLQLLLTCVGKAIGAVEFVSEQKD